MTTAYGPHGKLRPVHIPRTAWTQTAKRRAVLIVMGLAFFSYLCHI